MVEKQTIEPNYVELNEQGIQSVSSDSPQPNTPATPGATSNIISDGGGSVMIGGALQSPNFSVGVAGWQIDSNGNVEFNDGDFRGTLTAATGTIGGWSINSTSIYTGTEDHSGYTANAGDITIYSNGTDASIHAKNFYIDTSGNLTCQSAVISGTVTIGAGSSGIANLSDAGDLATLNVIGDAYITDLNVSKLAAGSISSKDIVLAIAAGTGDVAIRAGKTDFTNTESGFILGLDDSDSDKAKFYIGDATTYLNWTGSGLVISGNITATSGSSIATSYLSGLIAQANLNVSNQGWTQTCAFSVTDADTVAWGAGTFTSADGTAYSITGANTGNMTAKTYIYLDTAVSTTAYQVTTTATTAVGAGKVLVAIAQNGTTEASFTVLQGQGGQNIDAANIVAGSITGNEIAASTIEAGKLSVATLSAITANMGSITAGSITVAAGGNTVAITPGETNAIVAGPTGSPTFILTTAGALTATSATIAGYIITGKGAFGGDGSDGALAITSGTTTISAASASTLIKNYTSISITSTGKLAFSNPNTNGTAIILKSQGAVILTSTALGADGSTLGCIDVSNMGAAGGAEHSGGGTGNDGNDSNVFLVKTNKGTAGTAAAAGSGGAVLSLNLAQFTVQQTRYQTLFCGAGAGSGGGETGGGAISASGGNGGGILIIECAGDLNFPNTAGVYARGTAGGTATANGGDAAGGGGGGGGSVYILYKTATASNGTITVTGGTASNGVNTLGNITAGGGGGGSKTAGQAGSRGVGPAGSVGGNGGNGLSLIAQNQELT